MKTIVSSLVLSASLFFGSCQQPENIQDENKTIELDEKSALLIEADNEFGLDAFQRIRELSDKENIMISPLSISVALAMAYNGAEGDTKSEMEDALRLNGLSVEQINTSYRMLIDAMQSLDQDVVFEIANSIFYADGFTVKPDFLQTNTTYFDAEVESLDFTNPSSVTEINNWVAEKTNNKIMKIIDQLSPLDRMVLINAIYFNGIWATEFDEQGTKMRIFKKPDGSTYETPTMNKEDKLEYASNSLFESVKLPYGNGQYNMLVLLPQDGETSQDIIDNLSVSNWKSWANGFETHDHVVVTMPRYKFSFETRLNDVLKGMGMQKAFLPIQADFSKISDEDLYISSVKHKSFIDVNESGTEAAAVTSVTISTTSAGPESEIEKIYFTVDKPFVFAITEKDTDAILFIGEVQHPEYKE